MSNDFKIKNGLIINNTQPITGITNNSGLTNDSNSIPTMNSIKNFIESKITSTDNQIIIASGNTNSGTSCLTYDNTSIFISGDTKTSYGVYTSDGGMCIQMINKTGSPTVKGKLVTYNTSFTNSFKYFPSGTSDPYVTPYIGITTENGIPDGSLTPIVIYGVCYIDVLDSVYISDKLSTYYSTNDGDVLNTLDNEGYVNGCYLACALEDGGYGLTKCFLFNKDIQY